MDINVAKSKIEIDTTDDHEWVEIIGKTANEICNDPDCNRINEQYAGFIIESEDAGVSESLGWAIERHLNDIPPNYNQHFGKFYDTKVKKESLERS